MASNSGSANSDEQGYEIGESSNHLAHTGNVMGPYLPVALGRDWNIDDTIRVLRTVDLAVYGGDSAALPHRLDPVEINSLLCSAILRDLRDLVQCGQLRRSWLHDYFNLLVNDTYSEIGSVFDNWSENRQAVFEGLSLNDSATMEVRIRYMQAKICPLGDYVGKEGDMCTICLEQLYRDNSELGELVCGHEFHKTCVNKWFGKNNTCPFCRCEALPF